MLFFPIFLDPEHQAKKWEKVARTDFKNEIEEFLLKLSEKNS
jgi:hypothetical protein